MYQTYIKKEPYVRTKNVTMSLQTTILMFKDCLRLKFSSREKHQIISRPSIEITQQKHRNVVFSILK